MTVVLCDANNYVINVCQRTHIFKQLQLGDYSVAAMEVLEGLRKFCDEKVDNFEKIIICFDKGSWRKDLKNSEGVAYGYKSNRTKKSDKDKFKYELIFEFMNKFIEILPVAFRVMMIPKCEADDTIAVLAKNLSKAGKKVVILSQDVDFVCLTKYNGVSVYRINGWAKYPYYYKSEKVTWSDPEQQKMYSFIRGQPKDGVKSVVNSIGMWTIDGEEVDKPKIPFGPVAAMEVIDCLKNGGFKNCRKLNKFKEHYGENWLKEFQQNFKRNKKLLDFDEIPEYYTNKILEEYNRVHDEFQGVNFIKLFQKFNLYSLEAKKFMYNIFK